MNSQANELTPGGRRSSLGSRLLPALLLAGWLCQSPEAAAAAGSWHSRIGDLWLRVPGRETASAALPPPLARAGRLGQVSWRFALPPQAPVQAWLCHPRRCIELSQPRGRSRALAGLDAAQPLQFRFRLAPRAEPLQVRRIELIVEYR